MSLDLSGEQIDNCPNAVSAWCKWDGTGTIAIDDSYNVDSLTDNGTGIYDVIYATALADANYAYPTSTNQNRVACRRTGGTTDTTQVAIATSNFSSVLTDESDISVAILGGE